MKVANAISKLSKSGYAVETIKGVTGAVTGYVARKPSSKYHISFHRNGGTENVTCIRVMHCNDQDDIQTDYVAGVFAKNISQAISLAAC